MTRRTMTAAEIQTLIGGNFEPLENGLREGEMCLFWRGAAAGDLCGSEQIGGDNSPFHIVRTPDRSRGELDGKVMVEITCEGWLEFEYEGKSIYATISGCLPLDLEVCPVEGES